ncbi:MAG: alpha/beta fold hydrolase [Kiloniellales bacterium]|nr:alpha/beta fold hydrolase [Kiloniellales bacterium]
MPMFTLADGDQLYFEEHGEGPPLLLVSGLSGVSAFWSIHVPHLAQSFRVIVHDHRGTGQSSRSAIRYSVDQMADDIAQLMAGLGIERAHFVGHSTGGAIGQILAIDRPGLIDRLVLGATWTAADDYFRRCFAVRSEILRLNGMETYIRAASIFMRPADWVRDNLSRMIEEEARAVEASTAEIMLSRIEAILAFDRREDLSRITAPTLVLGARDDLVTPAYYSEALGELIPGAETVLLPRGGHFFPVICPEAFREKLDAFLVH